METQASLEDYVVKSITNEDLLKEVALHEAGHLVVGFFVERLNIGFKPVTAVEVYPASSDDTTPYGKVVGLEPPNNTDLRESYSHVSYSDTDALWVLAFIFQMAAGYATHKVFADDIFFISIPYCHFKREIRYHQIKSKFIFHGAGDIRAIKHGLAFMGASQEKYDNVIIRIFDDIRQILEKEKVAQAVILVQNMLLAKQGERIESEALNSIRETVNEMTKDLSLLPFLQKYENSI